MTTTPVTNITDEQLAEIENDGEPVQHEEAFRIIQRLRAAEKDAERYRWLRGNERNGIIVVRDYKSHLINEHLDNAIDNAMRSE